MLYKNTEKKIAKAMTTKIKKIVFYRGIQMLIIVLCFSCKSKESFDNIPDSYLIGIWKIEDYNNQASVKIEFQEQNKMFMYLPVNGGEYDKVEGSWTLNGLRKTIKFSFDNDEYEITKIDKQRFSAKNNTATLSFIKI